MDPRVELITRVIAGQKNGSRISAREAGALLGICEGHFLRLFKREVGTTFRRYKREARITRIVGLLIDNAVAVKQIAMVAGYEDVSNFHRDFKQVRGMSPRQWKMMELSKRPFFLNASD
jgi:AraC-like DNA-binding protein